MVRLPFIKIPNVRVGGIDPTSDTSLAFGGGEAEEPTPIEYLTAWRLVGNSEVHGNEIWSCGEYNVTDGKYHILVQPQGGSIADIALDEPLRKVNDVADTIEFPSGTEGKALVTRNLKSVDMGTLNWYAGSSSDGIAFSTNSITDYKYGTTVKALCAKYALSALTYNSATQAYSLMNDKEFGFGYYPQNIFLRTYIKDLDYESPKDIKSSLNGVELIYELATPTTELVDAPQIEEAESYSCVISQGAKAVEWSSFITNSE